MEEISVIGSGSQQQHGRLARGEPANQDKIPLYARPQRLPDRSINLASPVEQIDRLDYFSLPNSTSPRSFAAGFTSIVNYRNELDAFPQRNPSFLSQDTSNSFFAPPVLQAAFWPPLDIPSEVNVPPQYEEFRSPSTSDIPGFAIGSFETIYTPGPSTGSPQELGEFIQWSPPADDGNPIFDLEITDPKDEPPQLENNVYNPQITESFLHDPMPWSGVETEEMQVDPYFLVEHDQGNAFPEQSQLDSEYSRLGPEMETGDPWNALSAFDTQTARAQVFEKPLVPHFHGVSTSNMFGPQPIPDEHSNGSWTHAFAEPRRQDHSASPDSWRFENMSGIMKHSNSPESQRRRRGRRGKLSSEKKKTTKDVRQAVACWPCFLKKIKCSTEKRCTLCQKAVNPGKLVLLPCFRDPVESMSPTLVPDYVFGHMTEQTVTSYVKTEVGGWGTESIPMKLFWGLPSLIEVDLSVVYPATSDSKLLYRYESNNDENGRPKLIRTRNPLLGVQLGSLASLQQQYSNYVRDFVQNEEHLACYSRLAYEDEVSEVPGRLLEILCAWYAESRRNGYELPVLRDAFETHVVCTLIDRSFTLDQDSYESARRQLKYDFPRDASPSLVQKELKYIFFTGQARRIRSVLQEWGKSIRKDVDSRNFWIDFCVLASMCLVMDKTITSAYELHLYRMEVNLETNDRKLRELAGIIETELFQKSKEIFHGRHKTRKGGNVLKDDIEPRSSQNHNHGRDWWTLRLKEELRMLISRIGKLPTGRNVYENSYEESGRLTRIFLSDFL